MNMAIVEQAAIEMLYESACEKTLHILASTVRSFGLDGDAVEIFADTWPGSPKSLTYTSRFIAENRANLSIKDYIQFFSTPVKTLQVPWLSQEEWKTFAATHEITYQRKFSSIL